MYRVTGKLMSKGKRIGFEVEDEKGKHHTYSDNKIISLMQQGIIFDITYNRRGFQFKDKKRTIEKLPSIQSTGISLVKGFKSTIIVDEYTGIKLQNHIQNSNISQLKNRDFVAAIIEYCKSKENRVLSISGLRGTGKTTGVLQAIEKLNCFNEIVFINIDENANMNCLDLRDMLMQKLNMSIT